MNNIYISNNNNYYIRSGSSMSSIVDDSLIDYKQYIQDKTVLLQPQHIHQNLVKRILNDTETYQTQPQKDTKSVTSRVRLQNHDIIINFNVNKNKQYITIDAKLIKNGQIKLINSKQKQKMAIKQLSRRQNILNSSAKIYIEKGSIVFCINNLLRFRLMTVNGWVQIYSKLILRNIYVFLDFSSTYVLTKDGLLLEQKKNATLTNLFLSRNLSTISIDSQLSQSQSQYNYKANQEEKQRSDLQNMILNIQESTQMQHNIHHLYLKYQQQASSKFIKKQLKNLYLNNHKKLKELSALPSRNTQKKIQIQDYVFNTCKIELLEKIAGGRPIAEGGKFYLYGFTAKINLLSSDGGQINPKKDQEITKIVAIKKVKPQFQKKRTEKVQHERNITMKLKSSLSPFFPKYYSVVQQSQLKNVIIMEHLQGQMLDTFVENRLESFGFWDKVYVLLNVAYGMKVLKSHGIVHLDLKPVNIMIGNNMIPKIFDFGQSYHNQVCDKDFVPGFTFPYVAPEVYRKFLRNLMKKQPQVVNFSQKQDVFAFGMILSEIIFGTQIFQFNNLKLNQIYFKNMIYSRYFLSAERAEMYGGQTVMQSLLLLIQRCISPEPEKRPTFQWICIILKLIWMSYGSSAQQI